MNAEKVVLKHLSRKWLRARGPDALRFLNGMLTADMKRGVTQLGTGYTFLLNSKGKTLTQARFLVESETAVLLSIPDTDYTAVFAALDHLKVADDFEWEENITPFKNVFEVMWSPLEPAAATLLINSQVPNVADHVYRAIQENWGLRSPCVRLGQHHEELWVNGELPFAHAANNEEEFTRARILNGVPEWGVDFMPEALPLEFPIFDAISFHKGCYIGQEIVARATYRGQMPRAFCRFTTETPAVLGLIYSENDPDRPVGKVTTALDNAALGLLRLAALDGVPSGEVPIQPEVGVAKLFIKQESTGKHVRLLSVEDLLPEKVGA